MLNTVQLSENTTKGISVTVNECELQMKKLPPSTSEE